MKRTHTGIAGSVWGVVVTLPSWLAIAPICLGAFGAGFGAGCERASSEKIQTWKDTEKGPRKLQDTVKDNGVDPKLRAEAAVALVEIGMFDQMVSAVKSLGADDRAAVVEQATSAFATAAGQTSAEKARDARDALFALRDLAPAGQRQKIDEALLAAVGRELRAGQGGGGRFSSEKILEALGPSAAPAVLGLLEEPGAPLPLLVNVLAKSEPQIKEKAGEVLARRAAAAREVPEPLWRALGTLGAQASDAFLRRKVTEAGAADEQAVSAAQALRLRNDPSLLPFALEVAGDPKANKSVRDEMFELAGRIGGAAARDGLVKIIAADPNEVVRYRAFEVALAAAKADAILPALEAFPKAATYKRADVIDYLVADIQKLGAPAKQALPALLASPSALARMTGVLTYEALGAGEDAAALSKVTGDKGTVKGFAPNATVGAEASRVAALLQKKGR